MVVARGHVSVELRRPLHAVASAPLGRADRRSPGGDMVASRGPHRRAGAVHPAGRGPGRPRLRGPGWRRLHARPAAPAGLVRPVPAHLRGCPLAARPADRPGGGHRRLVGGVPRMVAVRPAVNPGAQPADRVHLQRAQQLDHGHGDTPPGDGGRLPQGAIGPGRCRPRQGCSRGAGRAPGAAGHHQPVRADRPGSRTAGAFVAAVRPRGEPSGDRGDRLPRRS